MFEDGFCLDIFGFLIAMPLLDRFHRMPEEIMESWGIYLNGVESQWQFDSVVWCWGDYTKFWYMPWQWKHIRTDVRLSNGSWRKRVACYEPGEPDGRQVWALPYRYVLRSGEVQERIATVHVERMEWRRKWTKWMPWFAKVKTYIEVEFSDEVGERTGSWKGGCIGCSYELLPSETPEQCLSRMERERAFD